MTNIAIIPARSGSKGFPNKNISKINNHTLIEIATKNVLKSNVYDRIIFTSDSKKYLDIINRSFTNNKKIILHLRKNNSSDTCEVDEMMIDVVNECILNKDISQNIKCLSLFYPTSPGRTIENIVESFKLFKNDKPVIGVVRFYDYLWKVSPYVYPLNYDPKNRKSRQIADDKYYRESKSIYHFSFHKLLKYKTRLYEPPNLFEVTEKESIDIDKKSDLIFFKNYEK